jgi:hypothetical protein
MPVKRRRTSDDDEERSATAVSGVPSGALTPNAPNAPNAPSASSSVLFSSSKFYGSDARQTLNQLESTKIGSLVKAAQAHIEELMASGKVARAISALFDFCQQYLTMCASDDDTIPSSLRIKPALTFMPPEMIPHANALKTMLDMACKVSFRARTRGASSFSGYAFSGPRGIGKSNMLKLAALASAIALPNYITVYLDLSSIVEEGQPPVSILQLIREAALAAGLELPSISSHKTSPENVADLVSYLDSKGVGIGLFLDELRHAYKASTWAELHTFVSNDCATSLFTADSCSSVANLICRRNPEVVRQLLLLPPNFELLQNLNETKVKVQPFSSFKTPQHYLEYLQFSFNVCKINAPDHLLPLSKDNQLAMSTIRRLHLLTGGVMRNIEDCVFNLEALDTNKSFFQDVKSRFPPHSDPLYSVFNRMARKHALFSSVSATHLDPFSLPSLTQSEVTAAILEVDPNCNNYVTLAASWVEDGLLDVDSQNCYTFSIPAHFVMTCCQPRIFLSHASDNAADIQKIQADFKTCAVDALAAPDLESQLAISFMGLRRHFESNQIEHVAHVAILLDKVYTDKILSPTSSGARREFFQIATRWLNSSTDDRSLSAIIVSMLDQTATRRLIKSILAHFEQHPDQLQMPAEPREFSPISLDDLRTFLNNVITYSFVSANDVQKITGLLQNACGAAQAKLLQ